MTMKITWTAVLAQTDGSGNVDGDAFQFSGTYLIAANPPGSTDLINAGTAIGSALGAQMTSATGYQDQLTQAQQSS